MDRSGIDLAVISSAVAGDAGDRERGDRGEAKELCELLNDEMSQAQNKHPGRIAGLAHLPFKDLESTMDLLEDAVERLDLPGV